MSRAACIRKINHGAVSAVECAVCLIVINSLFASQRMLIHDEGAIYLGCICQLKIEPAAEQSDPGITMHRTKKNHVRVVNVLCRNSACIANLRAIWRELGQSFK